MIALERVRRTLERLPPDALEMLAQAAIERLDAMEGDTDAEEGHEGCCDAGDDDPASSRPCAGLGVSMIGDDPDAEDGADAEPDAEGELSIGWPVLGSQACLQCGSAHDDLEEQCDDEGFMETDMGSSEDEPIFPARWLHPDNPMAVGLPTPLRHRDGGGVRL